VVPVEKEHREGDRGTCEYEGARGSDDSGTPTTAARRPGVHRIKGHQVGAQRTPFAGQHVAQLVF
jgi:hypothetical protein